MPLRNALLAKLLSVYIGGIELARLPSGGTEMVPFPDLSSTGTPEKLSSPSPYPYIDVRMVMMRKQEVPIILAMHEIAVDCEAGYIGGYGNPRVSGARVSQISTFCSSSTEQSSLRS